MSGRPLAYSLVRLMSAARSPTPRGIDRIDMGILVNLFETWPGDCYGVAPTLLGPRLFSRERVLRGCRGLQALWRENVDADSDPVLRHLDAQLDGRPAPEGMPPPARPDALSGLLRSLRLLFSERLEIGDAIAKLPRDALYLDMGHDGLTFPTMTGWLEKRRDIAPVVLIHDIIPLLYPAYEKPETVRRHAAAVRRAEQIARLILTPTQAVAQELGYYFAQNGGSAVPITPCLLPVDDLFLAQQPPAPPWVARSYFIVCGTLEPRKNQLMLIEAWSMLASRLGAATPTLIIAGARGSAAGLIDQRLAPQTALSQNIIVASGLGSLAMARLVANARALLMPSIAEGFGLPPLEAIALATPALVSDIPAHRDALGEFGQFLPPDSPAAWAQAIEAMVRDPSVQAEARARLAPHRPRSWRDYTLALRTHLDTVG